MAEVVKAGLIADAQLLARLKSKADSGRSPASLAAAIGEARGVTAPGLRARAAKPCLPDLRFPSMSGDAVLVDIPV